MKKVALLVNSLGNGGGEKIVSTIVNELSKTNQVEVILLENKIFYEIDENTKLTILNLKIQNQSNLLKFLLIPVFAWKLAKYVKTYHIDIVNSHLYRANYINVLAKIFGAKHKIIIVNHGDPFQYKKKGLLGKINLFLIKNLYHKSNLVITISKIMRKRILKIVPQAKIEVINNPYDINITKDFSRKNINFAFNKNKKYLICMGRLIKLKRFVDIIIAVSKLDENIELIILGDGIERKNLEKIAKNYRVNNRIHFTGNVKNPFAYLKKSDIFILSSESEGFPNSIIEALVCNLPIVSSDCISGPREILAPSSNINIQLKDSIEIAEYGILFPVGDVEKLVESINLLLENEKLCNQYIEKGQIRVNDFSVEKIVKKYREVFELE